jgi:hypothetical protein
LPAFASPARAGDDGRFSSADVSSFIRKAAKVGIATYRLGSRKPVVRVKGRRSPVRLTTALARSAALGAWARTGMTAGQLNAMTGPARLRSVRLPPGALVVAWAKSARTPSARLARSLLGPVDWTYYEQIVLPHAVLLLFSSDVAQAARPGGRRARSATATAALAAGPCSATQGFIDQTINEIFDAISRVKADRALLTRLFGTDIGPFVADLGDLLGLGVSTVGRHIVLGAVRIPVKVVVEALAGVSATVGVIGKVANAVLPWSGRVTIDRNPTSMGVGAGVPGALTLDVTAPGSEAQWPAWLRDCAELFKVPLPTTTPKDAAVGWDLGGQVPAGLVTPLSGAGTLDERGRAQLGFVTGVESPEVARGPARMGRVNVVATIHRRDLDPLVDRLAGDVLRLLPQMIRDLFGAQIRSIINPMLQEFKRRIAAVRDVSTAVHFAVVFHTRPPDPNPSPSPTPTPTPAPGGPARIQVRTGGLTLLHTFTRTTCSGGVLNPPFRMHAEQDGWKLDVTIGAWQGFGPTYEWPREVSDPRVEINGPLGYWTTAFDPDPENPGPGGLLIFTEPPDIVTPATLLLQPGANFSLVVEGPGHCGTTL